MVLADSLKFDIHRNGQNSSHYTSPQDVRKKAQDHMLRMKLDSYFHCLNLSYSIEENPEVEIENYIRAIFEISESKTEFEEIVQRIVQDGEVLLSYMIALSLDNDVIFLNVARTTGSVGLRNSGVDVKIKSRVMQRLVQIFQHGIRDEDAPIKPDKVILDYLNTYYKPS